MLGWVMNSVDLLDAVYSDLAALATSVDEADSWRPTGCPGWCVRDLVFHLLGDAQRALVALATPAEPPDRTAVTYWDDSPGQSDPDSRELRSLRTMASAWKLEHLTSTFVQTGRAVITLARRADPAAGVATQGHVLTTEDLLATLITEAVVHHIDLTQELDRPGPDPAGVELVAAVLDERLGRAVPDDRLAWVRLGTGRRSVTDADRAWLGADVDRLPLIH